MEEKEGRVERVGIEIGRESGGEGREKGTDRVRERDRDRETDENKFSGLYNIEGENDTINTVRKNIGRKCYWVEWN